MNLELEDSIMNLRTLSTREVRGHSLNISSASLSCHIPLRREGERVPTVLCSLQREGT